MAKKRNAAKPKTPGPGTAHRATVRMYRQGLGDCFLITVPHKNASSFRILIDCGVILGTQNATEKITQVAKDIVKETGGHVDILVATHQHWDHLSGFIQAAETFAKLKVDEVWVAWTEDPDDPLAKELRQERSEAITALRMSAAAMTMAGDEESASEVDNLLGFFGAAGGGSTEDAMNTVMKMGKLRFCRATDDPVHLSDPDVRLYVLGPPHDAKQIRQTLPSSRDPETYGVAAHQLSENVSAALLPDDNSMPFSDLRAIPLAVTRGMNFFRQRYWGPGEDAPDWRKIDTAWLGGASELALALDSATNNTSLVLAIEFSDGDVLLFVADAQVGNWLSWGELGWDVEGRKVTGPDLLARTIFYKVGHHGSHNATLRAAGLELMKNLSMAAIPVDHEMAVKKRWSNMPLPELVKALGLKAKDGVVRIDETPDLPLRNVTATDLYFDFSI
jgi:beta-lactamase superfamily II metal-dependent hydrolase